MLDTSFVNITKHRQKYTATESQRWRSENKTDDAERITTHQMMVGPFRVTVFPLHSIINPQSKCDASHFRMVTHV